MSTITNNIDGGNFIDFENTLSGLKTYIQKAVQNGDAAHNVEEDIFDQVLKLGRQALGYFFELQGTGDLGETITLGGVTYMQLNQRTRSYKTVFGEYKLHRDVYGTHESKKIACAPLDTRLQLPSSEHSYLLQNWSQFIASEVPFKKSMEMLAKILPIKTTVDSLERINQSYDIHTRDFREAQKPPKHEEKASLIVSTADGKGVCIKHERDETPIETHQAKKGPKPDRKRMAVVGSVYTVEPYHRTPEQVLDALFRAPGAEQQKERPKRPEPTGKRVIANLTKEIDGKVVSATTETFNWMTAQIEQRDSKKTKTHIALMDGQLSLWNELKRQMPEKGYVEILDLLHATSRLWDITNVFYSANDEERLKFIKDRVLRVLKGEAKQVISGVRQMATKRKLSKNKREKLEVACKYLKKNVPRMKYGEYLAQGFPIASGVIEGACRHFVKDRMERAGMQWTVTGAQAMLNVRATNLNGDWDEFTKYRIGKETEKLYAHRDFIGKVEWPLAA